MLSMLFGSSQVCFYRTIHEIMTASAVRVNINETGGYVVATGIYDHISFDRGNILRFQYIRYFSLFANDREIFLYSIWEDHLPVLYNGSSVHIVLKFQIYISLLGSAKMLAFYSFPRFNSMAPCSV